MAVELATAYISLVPSTRGFTKSFESGVLPDMSKSGATMGDRLMAGVGKAVKVGAVAVGGAAVAGLGVALTKGLGRLKAIDQAKAKLEGLGHSASSVKAIMDNALASVKGTAFGLDEAASVAASAVAAGVKPGADLTRTLKLVADAATIAGTDMGSMGAIFNKVAASNKVQMDVINQLHDAGVPALSLLAKQMGVTSEQAAKMASAGKIDFATFQAAMESGLGGAALKSGDTFSGAFDNMMAALSRFGANLLGGIFPQLKGGFGDLNAWLDSIGPVAENVGKKIGQAFTTAKDIIGGVVNWVVANKDWLVPLTVSVVTLVAAVKTMLIVNSLVDAYKAWKKANEVVTITQWALNAAMNANPIMLVVTAIAALVAGLVWFFTQTELGQAIWKGFTDFLAAAWTWLWESVLKPVIDFIAAAFTWLWTYIIKPIVDFIVAYVRVWAAIFSWLWQNILSPIFTLIGAIFGWLWETIVQPIVDFIVGYIQAMGKVFNWLYENVIKPVFDGVAASFKWVWESIIRPVVDFITGYINWMGDVIAGVFGGIAGIIKGSFEGVVGFVKWVFNSIIDMVNGVIDGINGVAGFVGGALGINVHVGRLPRLAEGGIVRARPGGMAAIVGEGRYDEAVVPLSPQILEQLGGGGSEQPVYTDTGALLGWIRREAGQVARLVWATADREAEMAVVGGLR